MEADDGEKSSRFRCLNAARYVVAALVTVLIVLISLNTAKLVLYDRSHDPVNLSVAKGFVYVRGAPPALKFYLAVRVSSDRGFRYYANITSACLFDGPEMSHAIVCFDDLVEPGRFIKAVEQQAGHYFLMESKGTTSVYFDILYNRGRSIYEVSLLLQGTFMAEWRSGRTTTSPDTTYYCGYLGISGREAKDDDLLDRSYDPICTPRE